MGYTESRLASELLIDLGNYLRGNDLGLVAGEGGMLRITFHRIRIPDVSFITWGRIPDPKELERPIPDLVLDLAVEVLSPSNTRHEMAIKLREDFAAGIRLIWYVNPPETWTDLGTGFRLTMSEWFDRAERKGPKPAWA